jgi:hypothetical protein
MCFSIKKKHIFLYHGFCRFTANAFNLPGVVILEGAQMRKGFAIRILGTAEGAVVLSARCRTALSNLSTGIFITRRALRTAQKTRV